MEAHGVRLVPLLQDHYCVPRMAVSKVNPEVGTIWVPSQAPLYQAPDPQQIFWGGYSINLGLPEGGGGGSLPGTPASWCAVSYGEPAANPPRPPSCTLGSPPSSYVSPRRLVLYPSSSDCTMSRTSGQAHGMYGIPCWPSSLCFSEADPFEEASEEVKRRLLNRTGLLGVPMCHKWIYITENLLHKSLIFWGDESISSSLSFFDSKITGYSFLFTYLVIQFMSTMYSILFREFL